MLVKDVPELPHKKGVPREDLSNLIMSSTPLPPEPNYITRLMATQMQENPPIPEPESVNSALPERSAYSVISNVPWSPAYLHIEHMKKAWFKFSDVRNATSKIDPDLPNEDTLSLVYSRCWKKLYQITLDEGVEFHEKIAYKRGWSKSTTVEVSPNLGLSAKGFTGGMSMKFNHTFSESEETTVEKQFDHGAPEKGTRCMYVIWQLVDVVQSLQSNQKVGEKKTNKGRVWLDPRMQPSPTPPFEYTWGFLIECPLEEYQTRSTPFKK
jgi:hypothetical protein